MSKQAELNTLHNQIYKLVKDSLIVLEKFEEEYECHFPFESYEELSKVDFWNRFDTYQNKQLNAHQWANHIVNQTSDFDFKEKMIFDSKIVWKELYELVRNHNDFLETDYLQDTLYKEARDNPPYTEINKLRTLEFIIDSRISIDEYRWHLCKRYQRIYDDYDWSRFFYRGPINYSLAELDRKLFLSFENIIQAITTPGGATPLETDYARSNHFANNHTLKSCEKLFTSEFEDLNYELVLSSSFMSALTSLILALLKPVKEEDGETFKLVLIGRKIYYEVLKVFGLDKGDFKKNDSNHITFFGSRLVVKLISSIDQIKEHNDLDAIYFESASNSWDGWTPLFEDLQNELKLTNCKYIIADTTLKPFIFSVQLLKKFEGTIIQLHSLTKYAQLGTNVSMGGLAIISKNSCNSICTELANRMKEIIILFGQHPNPNLAKTVCNNELDFKNRLARMRGNADVLKLILLKTNQGKKSWKVLEKASTSTNLIWIAIDKEWFDHSVQVISKTPPYGMDLRESKFIRRVLKDVEKNNKKLSPKEKRRVFKRVLEEKLWSQTLGEWHEEGSFLKTSFGFNQTTYTVLGNTTLYLRISCGVESMELLREIADNLITTLGIKD